MKTCLSTIFISILFVCQLWLTMSPTVLAAPRLQAATPTPATTQPAQNGLVQGIKLYEADQWQDALTLLSKTQEQARQQGEVETEGLVWLYIGRVQAKQGNNLEAIRSLESSALIWEQTDDRIKLLEVLEAIADIYFAEATYEQAQTTYTSAMHLAQALGETEHEQILMGKVENAQFQHNLTTHLADLEKKRLDGDRAKEAAILNKIGDLYRFKGVYDQALTTYQEELAIQRELASKENIADALKNIGRLYVLLEQYTEGIPPYQEAQTIAQEIGDPQREADLLNLLGELYMKVEQYAEARISFEGELAIRQTIKDHSGEAVAYGQLNLVYQALQQYDLAQTALEKEIALWQAEKNQAKQVLAQIELGRLFDLQQQYTSAIQQYTTILSSTQQLDDQQLLARLFHSLADDYFKLQDYDKALPHYEEALILWQTLDEPHNVQKVLRRMGELQLATKAYPSALQNFQAALTLAEESQDIENIGKLYDDIATTYSASQQWAESLSAYQKALAIWQHLEQPEQMLEVTSKIGDVYYRHLKEYDKALQAFQQALPIAQKESNQAQEAYLLQRIADSYQKQHEYGLALQHYEQALVIWSQLGDTNKQQKVNTDIANVQSSLYEKELEAHAKSGLIEPIDGATVNGVISIRGIANDPAFQKWQIDLIADQDPNHATFLELGRKVTPKVKKFMDLDTTQFPNGIYRVRLRVVRTDFNYDEFFAVITIANK